MRYCVHPLPNQFTFAFSGSATSVNANTGGRHGRSVGLRFPNVESESQSSLSWWRRSQSARFAPDACMALAGDKLSYLGAFDRLSRAQPGC